MTSFRVRPKIRIEIEKPLNEIIESVNRSVSNHSSEIRGKAYQSHIHLEVVHKLEHFWSPQLDLNIEEVSNEKSILIGRYGPKRNIWILFGLGYVLFSMGFVISLMIWLVKWNLHQESLMYIFPIVFGVLLITLYILAQIGQKVGAEQTFLIHHNLEESLGVKIPLL